MFFKRIGASKRSDFIALLKQVVQPAADTLPGPLTREGTILVLKDGLAEGSA